MLNLVNINSILYHCNLLLFAQYYLNLLYRYLYLVKHGLKSIKQGYYLDLYTSLYIRKGFKADNKEITRLEVNDSKLINEVNL